MPINVKVIIPVIIVIIVVIGLVFILFKPQEAPREETSPTPTTVTPTRSPSPTPTPIVKLYEITSAPGGYSLDDPTDEEKSQYRDVFKVIRVELRVSKNETIVLTISKVTVNELNNKSIPIGIIVIRDGVREDYFQITIPLTESEYRTLFGTKTTIRLNLYIDIKIDDKTETIRVPIRVVTEQTTRPTEPGPGPT